MHACMHALVLLVSQAVQRFVTRVLPALQEAGHVDAILMLRESDNFLTDMTLDVRFVLTPMSRGGDAPHAHADDGSNNHANNRRQNNNKNSANGGQRRHLRRRGHQQSSIEHKE